MYRYHPDKNASNPEASELFKEVAYSYSILSDPEKRRQYDNSGFEVCVYVLFLITCMYFLRNYIEDLSSIVVYVSIPRVSIYYCIIYILFGEKNVYSLVANTLIE